MRRDEYARMPFGKHKGRRITDVPLSYLSWVLGNLHDLDPRLRGVIRESLDRRGQQEAPREEQRFDVVSRDDLRTALRGWFRDQVRRYHPDHGGTNEAMSALNNAREELYAALGLE